VELVLSVVSQVGSGILNALPHLRSKLRNADPEALPDLTDPLARVLAMIRELTDLFRTGTHGVCNGPQLVELAGRLERCRR